MLLLKILHIFPPIDPLKPRPLAPCCQGPWVMLTCNQGLKALILKIIFPYAHAHTCTENDPGKHTSLITVFTYFWGSEKLEQPRGLVLVTL